MLSYHTSGLSTTRGQVTWAPCSSSPPHSVRRRSILRRDESVRHSFRSRSPNAPRRARGSDRAMYVMFFSDLIGIFSSVNGRLLGPSSRHNRSSPQSDKLSTLALTRRRRGHVGSPLRVCAVSVDEARYFGSLAVSVSGPKSVTAACDPGTLAPAVAQIRNLASTLAFSTYAPSWEQRARGAHNAAGVRLSAASVFRAEARGLRSEGESARRKAPYARRRYLTPRALRERAFISLRGCWAISAACYESRASVARRAALSSGRGAVRWPA